MRLQILHLPPIPGEPAPFALILDEVAKPHAQAMAEYADGLTKAADRIGARGVFLFSDKVEIP
jgi:hypothetical protein